MKDISRFQITLEISLIFIDSSAQTGAEFNLLINNKILMTSNELRDLVKSHFNLVEAEVAPENTVEETFSTEEVVAKEETKVEMSAEESTEEKFDARTDAEEEGYQDGLKDAVEDIKDAIAEVAKKDKLAEEGEEEKEEMMDVESIVEAIVSEVKEEMKKIKEKMAELEEKVTVVVDAPAAEATMMSSKPAPKAKFSTFNVDSARNADRIKAAMAQLKTKNK